MPPNAKSSLVPWPRHSIISTPNQGVRIPVLHNRSRDIGVGLIFTARKRFAVSSTLREYLEARRKAKMPQSPESGLFWHDQGNVRYTSHAIAGCLVDILRRAGLKPAKGKTGPRILDLRHSFVVNRILEWYRASINPQDKLPFLATYLGHRDIHSTLVYITVTQELLQPTNERFRTFASHCLHASEGMQP
jgi:integrase/recombinase XerD